MVLLLSGCRAEVPHTATATESPLPTETPTPAATHTPTLLNETSTPVTETLPARTQYKLQAVLSTDDKLLTVSEYVTYTNRSKNTLNELLFCVEANRSPAEFDLLAANDAEGSSIDNIELEGVKLTLPLSHSLQPGESVNLSLTYEIHLPSQSGTLSFGARQINLSGWYPVIVPYLDGQGWLLHTPGAVGEYQINELADFDVSLQIQGEPELKLAASTLTENDTDGFHYVANNVRNFTLSASSEYEVLETSAGETRIRAYVFPEHLDAGMAALQTTAQAVELYASLYGPYGRPSLTLVEATFADGMEYDGLYYLGQEYFAAYQGGANNYLTALSAHETAHQWWYAMVANDQASEPWLDEALCTFSERLFYEHEYPESVDWWLSTRIGAYQPSGYVNSSIYDFSAFRPYVNAVYLRGAEFLAALRDQMGESKFMAFLSDYFSSLKEISAQDDLGLSSGTFFWQTLSNDYDGDVSALRQEYFK